MGINGHAQDSFCALKGTYCVSFGNVVFAQIANNFAAQVDLYNETSAQICAKGGNTEGKEEP